MIPIHQFIKMTNSGQDQVSWDSRAQLNESNMSQWLKSAWKEVKTIPYSTPKIGNINMTSANDSKYFKVWTPFYSIPLLHSGYRKKSGVRNDYVTLCQENEISDCKQAILLVREWSQFRTSTSRKISAHLYKKNAPGDWIILRISFSLSAHLMTGLASCPLKIPRRWCV